MKGHIDGLSFFLGQSQGLAVKTVHSETLMMKNAIYFIDCLEPVEIEGLRERECGRHDFGMFDYATGKLAPIYNAGEIKRIQPSPIWFTLHP